VRHGSAIALCLRETERGREREKGRGGNGRVVQDYV
jgi:hypothetical protein